MRWVGEVTRQGLTAFTLTASASTLAFAQTGELAVRAGSQETAGRALERPAALVVHDVPLAEALIRLSDRSGVPVSFSPSLLPHDRNVSCACATVTVAVALDRLLERTALRFREIEGHVLIQQDRPNGQELQPARGSVRYAMWDRIPPIHPRSQGQVVGTVTDEESGEPIAAVQVRLEGTSMATQTDEDGRFTFRNVPAGMYTIVAQRIGYGTGQVQVTVAAGQGSTVDIALSFEVIPGEELVVVGYGAMQRRDITGSVASVDRREIAEIGSYAMDNVLQGRVAGVQVSAGGFRPGETSSIRIRGTRSLTASNSPLVVLDGIPIERGLMDLNPVDVASIEVLKDASATAIYGSRGANGVILITTRQGSSGIQIEYQGHTGFQRVDNKLDLMNAEQYAQFARDAYIAREVVENGVPLDEAVAPPDEVIFDGWAYDALEQGRSIDWQDLVAGRGQQQTHQLSILGGTETTRYVISGTYVDHTSPVPNNDYRRFAGRLNLEQQIHPRLQIGLNTHLSSSVQHEGVSFTRVLRNSPMVSAYDANGNPRMRDELGDRNPFFDTSRDNHLDQRERTRIISAAFAEVDLVPNSLSFRGMFSPDIRVINNGRYRRNTPVSDARVIEGRETSLLYENQLQFQQTFGGLHRLNVSAMHSFQRSDERQTMAEVSGLPYEHQLYHNLGSAIQWDNLASSLSEWKLVSYMLRSTYVYDDRYLLTLTGRVDGSSRLAQGNEYGFFPSGAIAWNIHNERFMQRRDAFNELKLRLSIGDVGNTAIGAYATLGQLEWVDNGFSFSDVARGFYQHGDIPNPDLTWERSRTVNAGLDWAVLNYRLQGSIDVYQTNTYDLLMPRQLPFTSGYTSALENVGETQNRGVELSFLSENVQMPNLSWQTELHLAWNRNRIVSLYGGKADDPGSGWFIGEPISVIWYWDWDGIWQLGEEEEAAVYGAMPGDVRVIDQNGDGMIDDQDRVIRGDPFPNWTAGLTNRISFRNLDVSAFVYASLGSMHYSPTHSSTFNDLLSLQFVAAQTNQMNVTYWMPDNPSNEYERPRFTSQTRTNIQAYWDTSFIRVKNVQVGYSLGAGLLSRLGLRQARIYAMLENPYTWTRFPGLDPEGARQYDHPNVRTMFWGVQVGF